jgi:hypothetical protein
MVLEDMFAEIIRILSLIVPTGVEPVLFYATFLVVIAISYLLFYTLIPITKEHKGLSLIISLVFAYFAASSAFVTVIVSKLFPNVGLVLMAILGLLLVIAFISPGTFGSEGTPGANLIMIAAFVFLVYATWVYAAPELARQGYIDTENPLFNLSTSDWAIVIIGIVVIGIAVLFFAGSGQTGGSAPDKFVKWLTKAKK